MLNDLLYAFRQLFKSPAFAIVSIATIALGIGANTAVFSVVNGVLLNPLPYPDPDRLVSLFEKIPNFNNASISYPNFLDWQRMNRSFSAIAAYRTTAYNLLAQGETEHLQGEMISAGFFEVLGVKPKIGRTFRPEDDRRGAAPTALISENLWKRRFGAAPNIIGRRLIVNGVDRTVVGVIPANFHLRIQNFQKGATFNDIYTPIGEYNEPQFYADRGAGWGMDAIGRLKPGVTFEMARQDMQRVSRELTAAYPDVNSNQQANLFTLKEEMVGDMRLTLLVLLGAVTFLLLISCVNVANLLLARSTSRRREFAIRLAMGAGQFRIMRQLLTESALLAVLGGGLGLLLARFGTDAALAAVPYTVPRAEEIGLDLRVLLFTTVTSLAAGMIFGLAPALKLRRANIATALKESGRAVTGSRSRTQHAFVIVEMALALVLLVGAGLMIRTLFVLWQLDPGFNPRGVLTFLISPEPSLAKESPAATRAFFRQLHDQLVSNPEVATASLSVGSGPMETDSEWYIWFEGRPKPAHLTDMPLALGYLVEPEYMKTLQISLLRGRFLDANDNERAPAVAVIDETLARKYYHDEDPIGRYLLFDNDEGSKTIARPRARIVGIVSHVNQWGLDADAASTMHAQMYLPIAQMPDQGIVNMAQGLRVYLRGKHATPPDFETLRQRVLALDRGSVSFRNSSMEQLVLRTIASKRFTMALFAVFAALALTLANIGIYGVLSYLVGQRTQEIGIRMALGAARFDVMRMILTDGARMTATGLGIGIIAALALTHVMSSLLFGVKPTDVMTFTLVVFTLCFIALLACYIPARRAMNIDPMIALRDE